MKRRKMTFSAEEAKAKNAVSEKTGVCCIIIAAAIFGMMPICAKLRNL